MQIMKLNLQSAAVIPLMAALPYAGACRDTSTRGSVRYNPTTQLSEFSHSARDYSTCHEDESISTFFKTKGDTRKDD